MIHLTYYGGIATMTRHFTYPKWICLPEVWVYVGGEALAFVDQWGIEIIVPWRLRQ